MMKELFLDDAGIEAKKGLCRSFHTPEAYRDAPIIKAELPWEGNSITPWTVIYDPLLKKFRMWYQVYYPSGKTGEVLDDADIPLRDEGYRYGTAYAESEDGYHFTKPNLGRVSFNGKDTNLAIKGYHSPSPQTCILKLDEPNPLKKYRLWVWDEAPYPNSHSLIGMSLYTSTDGYDWSGYEWDSSSHQDPQPYCYIKMMGNYRYPYNIGPNECNGIFWDEKIHKFVNYCRTSNGSARCIGRIESTDGIHWSECVMVAMPDLADPFMYQFYVSKPYRSGEFIILHVTTYSPSQGHKIEVEVLASRDGYNFTRVGNRKKWISTAEDSWHCGMVFATSPVLYGDKLWIYVSGSHDTHHAANPSNGIGLYHFRPDGYISLDATENEGAFTTRKMVWLYDKLEINADASSGCIKVEVLPGDKPGNKGENISFDNYHPDPIEGFEKENCIGLSKDSLNASIQFKNTSLSSLKGKYVQLKFYVISAKMYSWEVE